MTQTVILVGTEILDFDKFDGTGLIPEISGSRNGEDLPDRSTGSKDMNI